MKLWNVNTVESLQTYTGYKNRFTFLGLDVNSTHMVCGPEDNNLYGYNKLVSWPIMAYKLYVPAVVHTRTTNLCAQSVGSYIPGLY